MNTVALEAGDTCFSQHGQEGVFVARSGGDFIVRPIYEDDDGPHEGEVETWSAAFRTPPVPKLDAETKAAQERLNGLRKEISQLRAERMQMDTEHSARLARIKAHESLEMLDRYLAGELTHYVAVHDYYPTVAIIPIGETLESYASSEGYGLLTIVPAKNWARGITFSLYHRDRTDNRYRESRTDRVFPCCGEEDAKAVAAKWLEQKILDFLAKEPARRSHVEQLFPTCAAYGVVVPKQLLDDHAELQRRQLQDQREKAAKSLAEIDAKLNAAQPASEVTP